VFSSGTLIFHLKEPAPNLPENGGCWTLTDTGWEGTFNGVYGLWPPLPQYDTGDNTCKSLWLGPVLDLTNFTNILCYLDKSCYGNIFKVDPASDPAHPSYLDEYQEDYRGPRYKMGSAGALYLDGSYISLSLCDPAVVSYLQCHAPATDCSPMDKVWGWKLEWTDGYDRPKQATFTKLDSRALTWQHPLLQWVLSVESGANRSSRDCVCEMRLDFSPEKLGDTYGFVFPSGYDPCPTVDTLPTPSQTRFTDLIPLVQTLREQYLTTDFLPGSTLTLTPQCKPPTSVAKASQCTNCTGWIITSPYGYVEISGNSGTDSTTGYDYTITRVADGQWGQAVFNLGVALNDAGSTVINLSFDTGAHVDCCDAGVIPIPLGTSGNATITPVCPTECDSTCWMVEFQCFNPANSEGEDSVYGCSKLYQFWRFFDTESAATVLVDVVRLSSNRYFVIRDIYFQDKDLHLYSYATIQGGANCKTGGPWSTAATITGVAGYDNSGDPQTYAITGTITIRMPDTQTPTGSDKTVTTQRGGSAKTEYIFHPADFTSSSVPAVGIKIDSLPTNGTLWNAYNCNSGMFAGLDGNGQYPITAPGVLIDSACITNGFFGYIANNSCAFASPYDSFTFQLKGAGGCNGDDTLDPVHHTIYIDVTRAPNNPPATSDNTINIILPAIGARQIPISTFPFNDAGDSPCSDTLLEVQIVSLTTAGVLKVGITPVTAGQWLSLTQLATLNYVPPSDPWIPDVPQHVLHGVTIPDVPGHYYYKPFGTGPNQINSPYDSFTFRVKDNGGTDNGGNDTSSTHTISIRNA
jgi:hypothetical protein